MTYEEKKQELFDRIKELTKEDVAIAFSGGTDSALLLKIACDYAGQWGTRVLAVTFHTSLHPVREISEAVAAAQEAGAISKVIAVNELEEAGIEENPKDRCYLCKHTLFSQLIEQGEKEHVHIFMDGTNADDLNSYRPGLKALKELNIISPLAKVGLTKEEVRKLGREIGLESAEKPSAPCLATRFPYGTNLTMEKLEKVEQAEQIIKDMGFYNVRVRVHENLVRIEVDDKDIITLCQKKTEVIEKLKTLGYIYVTIDLEGFRSGSMDL